MKVSDILIPKYHNTTISQYKYLNMTISITEYQYVTSDSDILMGKFELRREIS